MDLSGQMFGNLRLDMFLFSQGFTIIFRVIVSMETKFVSCSSVAYRRLQTFKTTDKLNTSHYNLNTHLSCIFFQSGNTQVSVLLTPQLSLCFNTVGCVYHFSFQNLTFLSSGETLDLIKNF